MKIKKSVLKSKGKEDRQKKEGFFSIIKRKRAEAKARRLNMQEEKRLIDITGKDAIPKNKVIDGEFYYKAVPFTETYGLTEKQIKKQAKFYKKHVEKVVLIKMELGNGMFKEFLINEDSGCFTYKKNLYVLDNSLKYYLIDRNIWAYDFHEFLSIPLRKSHQVSEKLERLIQPSLDKSKKRPINPHVDTDEIKTLIENSGLIDVETSINPTTLKRFTDSEVIKQVLQGSMLSKVFKIILILIIIIAVLSFIIFLLNLYSSGIIQKIASGFHK